MNYHDHGEQVLSERDCPGVTKSTCTEQLRCQQVKVGRQEALQETLGLWECREGRANSTKESQDPFRISRQSHLLSTTASFIQEIFSVLC